MRAVLGTFQDVDSRPKVTPVQSELHLSWGQNISLRREALIRTDRFFVGQSAVKRLPNQQVLRILADVLQASLSDIQLFYRPEDIRIDPEGWLTLKQVRDAVHADSPFDGRTHLIGCMRRVPWDAITHLPVLELYQCLLPGASHAIMSLLRRLYDQQCMGLPRVLAYRGLQLYPSRRAYNLFSRYFTPSTVEGQNPLSLFLDPATCSTVEWRGDAPPRTDAPSYSAHDFGHLQRLFPLGLPTAPLAEICWASPCYGADCQLESETTTQYLAIEDAKRMLSTVAGQYDTLLAIDWDCGISEIASSYKNCAIFYRRPAFALREALNINGSRSDGADRVLLRPVESLQGSLRNSVCLVWIPFSFHAGGSCIGQVWQSLARISSEEIAIVVGPSWLQTLFGQVGFKTLSCHPIERGAGVDIVRQVLPDLKVDPQVFIFLLRNGRE